MGYVESNSSGVHISNEKCGNVTWEDNLSCYQVMIFYTIDHEFRMHSEPSEKVSNPDIERFYSLFEIVHRPLWEGCVHSQLSSVVIMLSNKSKANQSQNSFNQ